MKYKEYIEPDTSINETLSNNLSKNSGIDINLSNLLSKGSGMKDEIKELQTTVNNCKERINKAIEYIKEKARNNCWIDQYEANDLINILQGEDK